jgi:hypothetical protein
MTARFRAAVESGGSAGCHQRHQPGSQARRTALRGLPGAADPQSLQASDSHPSRSQLPAAHAKARRVEESGETARFVLTGRLTRKSSPWRLSDDSLTANPATYCRSLGGRSRIQCLRVSFTLARARAERYRQPPSVARMVSDDHASPGFRPTRLALTA